ncbi:hypothetical protein BV326_05872 [Pseudomonas syringae pv. actinidiae]|nr:hypothetical protein BV326_05872 [Pseudomonas syringae pv. actinidiae]
MTDKTNKNAEMVEKKFHLLIALLKRPPDYQGHSALGVALRRQSAFSEFSDPALELNGCSINTFKACAEAVVPGGFKTVDNLRLQALKAFDAHSTPSGHPVHQHPATYSTLIRPGSRSAATQVRIVSLKSLSSSISLRACASIHPSVRSDKRYVPAGRGSRRPRSDRRSAHAICPQASGW